MWAVYRTSLSIMAGVPSQDERSKTGDAYGIGRRDDTSPPNGMLAVNVACVHVYQSQRTSNQKLSHGESNHGFSVYAGKRAECYIVRGV
jgi:hypothetical protein